jgi:hypothetical protein
MLTYRHQLSETLADTDVDHCDVEFTRRPSGQEEFKIRLLTYGFRLLEEQDLSTRITRSHDYTVKTEAETFAEALPEHARRVAEMRRRIQFDFRKQLQANVKSEMQKDLS